MNKFLFLISVIIGILCMEAYQRSKTPNYYQNSLECVSETAINGDNNFVVVICHYDLKDYI